MEASQQTTTTTSVKDVTQPTSTPGVGGTSEDSKFAVDEISCIIKEAIEDCIGGNTYNSAKVSTYVSQVVETIMANLIKLEKPFKYVVNGTVMQKLGAGLHTSSSCLWDDNTDGSCTVRWENKTMYCIVSVYALAL
uniref:Dynein light chain Tctex-type 1 n=1 Tax=Cacopsylla melanoneura TaxID=428564 RepID=A0A8D8LKL8_9HEMI